MHLTGHYQPTLVVLSVVVSVLAAYTALDLATRLRAAADRIRWAWLAGAAVAMGGGIWTMHFIGMLALSMPMPVAYDVGLTVASLLLPILVSAVGLAIIGRDRPSWRRLGLAGVLMGLGIVTMHYLGMAAMIMDAVVTYDPARVALSVMIAIGASIAALRLASTVQHAFQRFLSAVIMGMAVVGMHYTGMSAASFSMAEPSFTPWFRLPPIDADLLALEVAGLAGALFLLALVSAGFDRRSAERRAREAQQRLLAERQRAEAVLRESEDRYRLAIEATGLGTWDWNLITGELLWSERTFALYGLPLGSPVDYDTFLRHLHSDDRAAVHARVQSAIDPAGSGTFSEEFRIVLPDGSTRWLHATGKVSFDVVAGKRQAVRFLGTLLDTTERRLAEEQLRASLAEKETLLQEVHHRVKNNMQVISSLLRMERRGLEDGHARERLDVIGQRIQAMARLHEQLYATKDLARIDFGAYLRDLAQSLADFYVDRPVRVEIEAEPLACDLTTAIPLGLIANELVTNSLKHGFPNGGGGTVSVSLARMEGAVMLEVRDDGIGPGEGSQATGLGSRIVSTLARQLDAQFEIRPGKGYVSRLLLSGDRFEYRSCPIASRQVA